MSDLVVIEHYRDPFEDVYRLTIGYVEERQVPVLDEHGEPQFWPDGEDGTPGEPAMETLTVSTPVEDFVFSCYDERWNDKTDDEVAVEQKRLVRVALRKRDAGEAAAAAAAARLVPMPGVGETL